MDEPENFRWTGDVALDGELVYASGEINVALQKPSCSVGVEERWCPSPTSRPACGTEVSTASRMKVDFLQRTRSSESRRNSYSMGRDRN